MEQGYVYIFVPDHPCATQTGYVLEHRLVMENHLCQYLSKYDEIHHINGNRADNRIENLICLSREQHRKIEVTGRHHHTEESKRRISIANSGENNGMSKKKRQELKRVG